MTYPTLKRRRVNNPRNSKCTARLSYLDWSNWWQDDGYLHVECYADNTAWRVYPREIAGYECTRLRMIDGELYWLYDKVSDQ